MQIDSRPLKRGLSFAFTYLAVVALQTLDGSFGPVAPPSLGWPLRGRSRPDAARSTEAEALRG